MFGEHSFLPGRIGEVAHIGEAVHTEVDAHTGVVVAHTGVVVVHIEEVARIGVDYSEVRYSKVERIEIQAMVGHPKQSSPFVLP